MGKNWRVKMGIDGPKGGVPLEATMVKQGMVEAALMLRFCARNR